MKLKRSEQLINSNRATVTERTDLAARKQTYVVMRLLHKFQEGRHIRPAEVIDGFQSSEHATFAQPLEVVLANILKRRHSLDQYQITGVQM